MRGRKSSKEAQGDTGLQGTIGAKIAFALLAVLVMCIFAAAQENTADYWLEKAYELSANGSHEEALQAYDKVLEKDPSNYTALINKGHDLKSWAFENYNKALEITNQILEKNPQDALAWQGKGAALSGLGSNEDDKAYAKAIEILDSYTKKDPKNASAWFLKGEDYANMHKVEDALAAYEKVIELNYTPRLEAALVTKAVLLAELHRFDEALEASEKAIELNPKSTSALSTKDYILREMGRGDDEALMQITNVTSLGKDEFIEIANKGNETQSFKNMTLVADEVENKSVALPDINLEPGEKIRIHFGQGETNETDLFLNSEVSLDDVKGNLTLKDQKADTVGFMTYWTPADDWMKTAGELSLNGSFEEAVLAIDKAIEIEPQNATLWDAKGLGLMMVAVITSNMSAFNQSIQAYDKAVELDPENLTLRINRGFALRQKAYELPDKQGVGILEDALLAFDQILALNSSFGEAWTGKGVIFDDLAMFSNNSSKYNDSLSAFDKAIELVPAGNNRSLAHAYEGKAVALSHMGGDLNKTGKYEEARAKYEEAITNYDKVIELDPDFVGQEAQQNRAGILEELGRHDESAAGYEKAMERLNQSLAETPKDAGSWVGKGILFMEQGYYDEAVSALDNATKADPGYVLAWKIRGFVLLEDLGRSKEAQEAFDRALELDSVDAQAWRGKGDALYMMGRYEDAIKAYDVAIRIDPESDRAYLGRGDAQKVLLRNEEAMKSLNRTLEINPNSAEAWGSKGYIFSNMFQSENATLAYERALKLYEDRLKRDPRDFSAWIGRGDSLGYMGLVANNISSLSKLDEAVEAFDKAIEINPENAKGWFRKGEVLSLMALFENESETYNQSLQALDTALAINPEYAEAWKIKGATLMDLGRYNESASAFEKALEIAPGLPGALEGRAMALKELGKTGESPSATGAFDEAIDAYDQIIKAANSSQELSYAWISKGIALYELGRYVEAFDALDNATKADPKNLMAWMTLADALASQHMFNESLVAYNKTIENIPANSTGEVADVWFHKADVLLEANRTAEAGQAIDRAQQIDPANDYVWVAEGNLLNKTGRYEEALTAYDKAIEELSSSQSLRAKAISSRAWHNKGDVLNASDRKDEADAAYAKARELGFKG